MTTKRKAILFGVIALLGYFVSLAIFQMSYEQDFWLHAIAFPINPRTLSQPTGLTNISAACSVLCPLFLIIAVVSVIVSICLWCFGRSTAAPPAA
jgi:hypothetical protein